MGSPRITGAAQRAGGVADQMQQIARVLEGRALTIDEIAEKTGIARSSIQVRLKELREEGRLISGDIHGVRCYTLSDDA